ncbi:hypothetical protein Ga0123462_0646 [Mariprofundus ferrinatatus]|uniref:Uncharacterized protein n=1 Tax=Mariprofundus ferrinatatus TaxID=1921087 RepID=A0A2K8LB98_9PROT|nr:hypothetical protein Ga0123462_0646 [Mariprofundus ferrinatatus]
MQFKEFEKEFNHLINDNNNMSTLILEVALAGAMVLVASL